MNQRFVHPQMLSRIVSRGGFFPATCDIASSTASQDDYGAEVLTWATVHEGVACRLSPVEQARGELRLESGTVAEMSHVLTLPGAYALSEMQRVTIDGTIYEIVRVDGDGNGALTRLMLRLVR